MIEYLLSSQAGFVPIHGLVEGSLVWRSLNSEVLIPPH